MPLIFGVLNNHSRQNRGDFMSNWIKIRTHLLTHPHCVRIASALCLHGVHVLGALVHTWSVADSHADGDLLKNMTPEALDSLVSIPGFTSEMAKVGWVIIREDGLQLVNYQEHNGASAKRRALEAKRKGSVRILSASCPHDVRIESGHHAELDKNKNKKKKKEANACAREDDSPIVATYPTDGPEPEYHLRESQVAKWREVYRGVDVVAECHKAGAWIEANPGNQPAKAVPRPTPAEHPTGQAADPAGVGTDRQGRRQRDAHARGIGGPVPWVTSSRSRTSHGLIFSRPCLAQTLPTGN